jgi:hypothetical protein
MQPSEKLLSPNGFPMIAESRDKSCLSSSLGTLIDDSVPNLTIPNGLAQLSAADPRLVADHSI